MADAMDIEELYSRHGPMVLRRCRSLLKDEERAMEAMQDTFVQLLRRRDVMEARFPTSLLYTMATNICLNHIRSAKRRPEDPDDMLLERIAGIPDHAERSAARLMLDRLFQNEQPSTRTMAVLHLRDGLTLEQVAEATGLSVSGVRKRLRGLRAHLHELEAA